MPPRSSSQLDHREEYSSDFLMAISGLTLISPSVRRGSVGGALAPRFLTDHSQNIGEESCARQRPKLAYQTGCKKNKSRISIPDHVRFMYGGVFENRSQRIA